ncbi:GntR family transcriptional regulator [uncultured Clostridium sp.]|uniref:GntR family transcriptional regulator n=1 Tax=uncultured Clostridium sp. TaxID=59620 RepID=UPI00263215C4|nr:GntR family transcriptional regulator [uncultured Clostridium sp.]
MSKALKIASDLERKIHKGVYTEGDKLPTEMQLCDMYDVSRMTIRKALEKLIEHGWLYRIQGSGNYVKRDVSRKSYSGDTKTFGLTQYLNDKSIESKMIRFDVLLADKDLANKLYCKLGDMIYYVERIRIVNGEPYVLEKSFFLEKYVRGLNEEIIKASIYSYVENELGYKIQQSTDDIRARIATEEEAELLECPVGSALLTNESTVYLDNGQIFEYSKDMHRGDKANFIVVRNKY